MIYTHTNRQNIRGNVITKKFFLIRFCLISRNRSYKTKNFFFWAFQTSGNIMKRVPIPPGVPKFIHKGSLLAFKVYMYHIRGRLIDKNFFVVRLLLIKIFRTLSDNPTLGVRTRGQKHVKKKKKLQRTCSTATTATTTTTTTIHTTCHHRTQDFSSIPKLL